MTDIVESSIANISAPTAGPGAAAFGGDAIELAVDLIVEPAVRERDILAPVREAEFC